MKATDIRHELLAALSELSQLRPEWRLGQTLANLAMTAGRLDQGSVWDLKDEEALEAARKLIEQYSERELGIPETDTSLNSHCTTRPDVAASPIS